MSKVAALKGRWEEMEGMMKKRRMLLEDALESHQVWSRYFVVFFYVSICVVVLLLLLLFLSLFV